MKTLTLYGLTAIFILGLVASASAQNTEAQPKARDAMFQFVGTNSAKQRQLSYWTESGKDESIVDLFHQIHFKDSFGEQGQKILDSIFAIDRHAHEDPDIKPIRDEADALYNAVHNAAIPESAMEETQTKLLDLQQKVSDIIRQKKIDVIYENLTPEQIKIAKEYQITTMAGDPYSARNIFGACESLGLSNEQKKQFEAIKKELKPEFEKLIVQEVERQSSQSRKLEEEIARLIKNVTDPDEINKTVHEVHRKFCEHPDPDELRARIEYSEANKAFTDKLKIKIFDVLSDEQWEHFQNLVDNPPDHIKKILGYLKQNDVWTPGPNSWKPGDPVPEQYRQERNTRKNFPRKE